MNEARKRRLEAQRLQRQLAEAFPRRHQQDFTDRDPFVSILDKEYEVEDDTPGEVMFPEHELASGMAAELRKVQTPRVGEQFDTVRMMVDAVLVLNRAVERLYDLEARIIALEIDGSEQPSEPEEEAPAFKLQKLTDSYEDVGKQD